MRQLTEEINLSRNYTGIYMMLNIRRFVSTELLRQGAEFRRVQFHLGRSEPKSAIAYLKLSKEVEARRNGEMLRLFFKKVFKRRKHNATKE